MPFIKFDKLLADFKFVLPIMLWIISSYRNEVIKALHAINTFHLPHRKFVPPNRLECILRGSLINRFPCWQHSRKNSLWWVRTYSLTNARLHWTSSTSRTRSTTTCLTSRNMAPADWATHCAKRQQRRYGQDRLRSQTCCHPKP